MLQTRAAQDASGNYLSNLTGQPLPEMQHEDHLAPLAADLSGSLGGLVVPTLVVGGLMALSARRARVEEDSATTGGEV